MELCEDHTQLKNQYATVDNCKALIYYQKKLINKIRWNEIEKLSLFILTVQR